MYLNMIFRATLAFVSASLFFAVASAQSPSAAPVPATNAGRQEQASIPDLCLVPQLPLSKIGQSCPSNQEGLRICAVYKHGDNCESLCRSAVFAHAARAHKCPSGPTFIDMWLLEAGCRRACWSARKGVEVRRKKGLSTAQALVQAAATKDGFFTSKMMLFAPKRRFTGPEPDHFLENPVFYKPMPGQPAASPAAGQSCWFCRWMGVHCPHNCFHPSTDRWRFRF